MLFPTAVRDETLAPQFGVETGRWGGDVRLAELRYQCYCVFFFFLIHALEDRPAPQLIGLWCRGKWLQPDRPGAESEAAAKVFPSQRAAQERLFLEALRCEDFALSSLSLREFVFTSDLFMGFITL